MAAAALPNNYLINAEIVAEDGQDKDPRAEAFEEDLLELLEEQSETIEAADDNIRIER